MALDKVIRSTDRRIHKLPPVPISGDWAMTGRWVAYTVVSSVGEHHGNVKL
jgi:hypothetical protein